ncbi:hypothetical protein NST11_05995 [Caldifermentibacillus hisashii]|uniref:hypothetical protein n=1 Tax=Caldifermentibacillus hisashii TaxID=996558 RepID=UPI0031B7D292
MIDKRKGMVLITLVLTIILFACGKNEEKSGTTNGNAATISISGSTSVGPLAEKLAEKYKEKNNVT